MSEEILSTATDPEDEVEVPAPPKVEGPEPTPMVEYNEFIGKQQNLEKLFFDIFLETYDIENGFHKASETYTSALLKKGIQVNPQAVYTLVDQVKDRLLRVNVVKRLCMGLSLQGEYDRILDREMNLFYTAGNSPKPVILPAQKIMGEKDKDE